MVAVFVFVVFSYWFDVANTSSSRRTMMVQIIECLDVKYNSEQLMLQFEIRNEESKKENGNCVVVFIAVEFIGIHSEIHH